MESLTQRLHKLYSQRIWKLFNRSRAPSLQKHFLNSSKQFSVIIVTFGAVFPEKRSIIEIPIIDVTCKDTQSPYDVHYALLYRALLKDQNTDTHAWRRADRTQKFLKRLIYYNPPAVNYTPLPAEYVCSYFYSSLVVFIGINGKIVLVPSSLLYIFRLC